MGNESSSPTHDRYDDDETTIDGTSVFSTDTRETGFSGISGVSRDTGMSSRIFNRGSSSSSNRGAGAGFGGVLNGGLMDAICGNNFFEEDDEDDDRYNSRRRKSDKNDRKKSTTKRKDKRSSREHSQDDSYDSDGSYNSQKMRYGRSSKSSKHRKEKTKSPRSDDSYMSEDLNNSKEDTSKNVSKESAEPQVKHAPNKEKNISFDSNGSNTPAKTTTLTKPLASSFAKRCYFTKAGIGKNMQHYEGITLTGNTVLMLASAMKLKGCPTICDEDLRRVEQTYPNQFSRLPDELLLSSGWRRISKYCHFSSKAVPDGIPFFHSRERCHPNGGYYFLLAASIGMERPSDVEPLTLDMLILLQTDYPTQCDQTPNNLIEDPTQWTLVTRFCFFSGGPINCDEDVYYMADFNGNSIYMLAFLSPNMTPEELYRLNDITGENALKSVAAVEEVEAVYDLTERDFDDLKMYHLGPCRALPHHLLAPEAWEKVLPKHFMECRENALARAFEYEVHAQEAIAKAGKMVGVGHTRTHSYESMGENIQKPYDSNYTEATPQPPPNHHQMNDQYGSQTSHHEQYVPPHQISEEQEYNGPSQHEQGSYVEMHQIGDVQGQFTASYRSSGDEGTLGMGQQQGGSHHSPEAQNSTEAAFMHGQNSNPSQSSQQYEQTSAPGNQDDQTAGGVLHDDPTVDAVTCADDPTVDAVTCADDPTVGGVTRLDDPTVGGDTMTRADEQSLGDTMTYGDDPTLGDTMTRIEEQPSSDTETQLDPPTGDAMTRVDDPTVGGIVPHADDHTIGNVVTHADDTVDLADDPTVGGMMTHVDDLTVGGATARVEDPTIRDIDSDDRVLDDYYKGLEEQQQQEEHPDDEFPIHHMDSQSDASSNHRSDLDAFQQEMKRVTLEESSFVSPQQPESKIGDSGEYPSYENMPETPQDSEYVSMQELDPASPEVSFQQEFDDHIDDKSMERNDYAEPPSPPSSSEQPQSRLASPRLASPRQSQPRLSSPRLASPKQSQPRLSSPRLASPKQLQPRLSSPRQDSPPSSPGPPSPPTTPQGGRADDQPTRISTYAGYGFARQFSSTPRAAKPSTPLYATPRRTIPPVQKQSAQETYDDPSVDDVPPSPKVQLDPPSYSPDSYDDNINDFVSPQSTIASPQSRGSKSAISPDSFTQGTSSTAMRGARELLKKNRQERLALMSKRKVIKTPVLKSPRVSEFGNENKEPAKSTKKMYSHARSRSVTPNKSRFHGTPSPIPSPKMTLSPASPHYDSIPPKTPPSSQRKSFNKDLGYSPKSDISGASSAWTEDIDSPNKDSRRALILKMAKNRMRSKKELKPSQNHKMPVDLD